MKMVTASDVDISVTSTAETPTSEMSTSYSTNGETKKEQTTTDAVPWIVSTVASIAAMGMPHPYKEIQHQPILCPPTQQTEIQFITTQQPAMFTASTGTKRPQNNDVNLDNMKKTKITAHYQYEDVTPPSQDEIVENIPPEILDDFYYTPFN
ncbi:unnamed protein product [Mytilus coruscus]|uniref:Uncharacterized protein n=1 Tax=Mytilus coruscus TaxID=42192 RepID=A0A6J8ECZ6_MYTCO|nr:unnamed protein product [Mytilus coruscus]